MITCKEKNNQIEVTATLSEADMPRREIRTSDIVKYLNNNNITFVDIIEESHVHNHSADKLTGKWLFSKEKSKKTESSKSAKNSLTDSSKSAKVKGKRRKDA